MLGTILKGLGSILSGGGIIKDIFGGIQSHFKHKRDMKLAKQNTELQIELKKQEILTEQSTSEIKWDQTMAENSATSWKDEFWTVLLAIPVVLVFIPDMAPYISEGFKVLQNDVPDWYKLALGTAIAAAFGRHELVKWMKKK